MAATQKRKGRWSSRSFFGLKTNHKRAALSKPTFGVGDATIDSRDAYIKSSKALSASQMSSISSSTVENLRHRGSRLLSIIRLHGSASDRGSTGKLLSWSLLEKSGLTEFR